MLTPVLHVRPVCFSVQHHDKSGPAVGPFELDVRPDQIARALRPELLLVHAGPRIRPARGAASLQDRQRRPLQRFQVSGADMQRHLNRSVRTRFVRDPTSTIHDSRERVG